MQQRRKALIKTLLLVVVDVLLLQEMQEAVSNVYILNQNIEHLNDVVREQRAERSRGASAYLNVICRCCRDRVKK